MKLRRQVVCCEGKVMHAFEHLLISLCVVTIIRFTGGMCSGGGP